MELNDVENEYFLGKMKEIVARGNYDKEANHGNADDLLCLLLHRLGYVDVVEEYQNIGKWYA